MPRITISYRRDDSGVITGRIFDRLVGHYGRDAVFRDIDNIPLGVDFRKHIEHVFDSTDIVLAIVGPHWIGPSAAENRLGNDADPVRVEIEGALRKGATLIPVLVLGARMPTAAELPEPLRDFAYRNAVQLDAGQDFDQHMARLIRGIDGILGLSEQPARPAADRGLRAAQPGQPRRGRWRLLVAAIGCVAVAALAFGVNTLSGRDHASVPPDSTPVASSPATPSTQAPPPTAPATPATEAPAGKGAEASPPVRPTAPAQNPDAELLFWQSIMKSGTAADYDAYLRQYPDGRFAGLARNRIIEQSSRQPPEAAAPIAAAAPAARRCGGNSDEQVTRPVKLLYEAVNSKNIGLYAEQWHDDGTYRNASSGAVHGKGEKIAERQTRFTRWEQVRLVMESATITNRTSDSATVRVIYSMMVKNYGRPAHSESGVREEYVVTCGREGKWLISSNIDEIK